MHPTQKLYIVTRRDIPPGLQAAQSVHAAFEFAARYPLLTKDWMRISNYICILAVDSEAQLYELYRTAYGIRRVLFREPDLNNQVTAIALEPSPASERLVSECDLALKEYLEPFMYG